MNDRTKDQMSAEEHCKLLCAWKGGGACQADGCPRHRTKEQKTPPEGAISGVVFLSVPCNCWAWVKDGEPEWHWPSCTRVPSKEAPSSNERVQGPLWTPTADVERTIYALSSPPEKRLHDQGSQSRSPEKASAHRPNCMCEICQDERSGSGNC